VTITITNQQSNEYAKLLEFLGHNENPKTVYPAIFSNRFRIYFQYLQ